MHGGAGDLAVQACLGEAGLAHRDLDEVRLCGLERITECDERAGAILGCGGGERGSRGSRCRNDSLEFR